MSKPSIFEVADFGGYLRAYVEYKQVKNPAFSLRALARQVEGISPSLVIQIASGKRRATVNIIYKMREPLKLTKREYEYAIALVNYQQAKDEAERELLADQLRNLRPLNQKVVQELDCLQLFSNWYNTAIQAMTWLADFNPAPHIVARRLGNGVSTAQAEEALGLLQRLGLLVRKDDGRFAAVESQILSKLHIPITAVRGWHKKMMSLAADALDKQKIEERFFIGTTMTIDTQQIERAQEMIEDFRQKLVKELSSERGDETYHFAVQLFRLTDPSANLQKRR